MNIIRCRKHNVYMYVTHYVVLFSCQVRVMDGSNKGLSGTLINIDEGDGIVKVDADSSLKIIALSSLGKLVPRSRWTPNIPPTSYDVPHNVICISTLWHPNVWDVLKSDIILSISKWLVFWGPPIYVFEDPEPNEAEQDLMMELDCRNLHVHIETCVSVCVCLHMNDNSLILPYIHISYALFCFYF